MPTEDTSTCDVCAATTQGEAFCPSCGAPQPDRPTAPQPGQPGAPQPDGEPSDARQRARELLIPVAEPAHSPRPAAPVLPGVPEPAGLAVRLPTPAGEMNGPPCPWCGTPNPRDRHFCRRCGTSLASAPAQQARLPWWRRLFSRSGRELPYAGQRPRLRRDPGRLMRWLALASAAGLAAFAAVTWASPVTADVRDHFTHPDPVFATRITASHSDPAHPVAKLHDGYDNTWWGTGEAGSGTGVHVRATFAQPINLLDIVIIPGAGISQSAFTAQSRPQSILVKLVRAGGTSTTTTITLADSPGPQTFAIHASDVVHIRFTLESAYLAQHADAQHADAQHASAQHASAQHADAQHADAQHASAQHAAGTEVAIAEIEFFAAGTPG